VIDIREAEPSDYASIIGKVDEWWGGRNMAAMLPKLFFKHFRQTTFVAHDGSDILGFIAGFQSQTDPAQAYVHFIGVDPRTRGSGVGRQLFERLFAAARALGCTEALSVTSPLNRGSIAFHRSLGFAALPGDREADGVPYTADYDGPGEDRVRFRREL
jgi:L-amino acid N-acyltransferase YncA